MEYCYQKDWNQITCKECIINPDCAGHYVNGPKLNKDTADRVASAAEAIYAVLDPEDDED